MFLVAFAACFSTGNTIFVEPNQQGFGAQVKDIHISTLLKASNLVPDFAAANVSVTEVIQSDVALLRDALHTYHFLHFTGQEDLTWEEQLTFVQLFGEAYDESLHVNRRSFPGEKDPRVAVFSNHPDHGLANVGIEGFHSDGNVVPIPHKANILFCESAIEGGDTELVPLDEVAKRLDPSVYTNVNFVSGHVEGLNQPLVYPHPSTGRRTMFFGLGRLSGRYTRHGIEMTQEETDQITDAIQNAIEEVGPYHHKWKNGDILMIDNLAMAHKASPGSQKPIKGGEEIRIMRRVTLSNKHRLRRRLHLDHFPKRCTNNGICLVSLANWVEYNGTNFPGIHESRELCKYAIDETADLAVLPTRALASMATEIVTETQLPHWIFGSDNSPHEKNINWSSLTSMPGVTTSSFAQNWEDDFVSEYPWDGPSGQPNDCDGPGTEPCMFVGPFGNWFDFACDRKKPPSTPGPEITWTDGKRKMYNLYPLCMVDTHKMQHYPGMFDSPAGEENQSEDERVLSPREAESHQKVKAEL